jgi:hypothetical protein
VSRAGVTHGAHLCFMLASWRVRVGALGEQFATVRFKDD